MTKSGDASLRRSARWCRRVRPCIRSLGARSYLNRRKISASPKTTIAATAKINANLSTVNQTETCPKVTAKPINPTKDANIQNMINSLSWQQRRTGRYLLWVTGDVVSCRPAFSTPSIRLRQVFRQSSLKSLLVFQRLQNSNVWDPVPNDRQDLVAVDDSGRHYDTPSPNFLFNHLIG